MKDELRTAGDPIAWRIWSTAQNQLWNVYRHVYPSSRGRTSHIAAVHL